MERGGRRTLWRRRRGAHFASSWANGQVDAAERDQPVAGPHPLADDGSRVEVSDVVAAAPQLQQVAHRQARVLRPVVVAEPEKVCAVCDVVW